ncbi:MAG: hypothetical protein AAGF50_02590 [Pseudomonadota bacterium]
MITRVSALALAALGLAGAALADCDADGRVEIYPTAEVLPENLLRIYVYFPHPMDTSQGVEIVQLLDAAGDPVEHVFLRNRDDLWSPDRRRLTVLLDPGRVKTGLEAHDALGRALVPGQSYAFEVSGRALQADGCALGASTRHAFQVGPADLEPPQPSSWQLAPPQADTTDNLEVALGSAHDHLSLAFRLRVLDGEGTIVPGAIALGPGEASWNFTPRAEWRIETYTLAIDERLEDLAGNRPGLLFDRPLDQPPSPWVPSVPFMPVE